MVKNEVIIMFAYVIMASTRNKNTPGNYSLEQWSFQRQSDYSTYKQYAFATPTALPGHGLLGARIPETEMANNPQDIESMLFGIGSTNLVEPQSPVQPNLKSLPELSIVDRRVPLILPKQLVVQKDQRPYPI